MRLLGTSGQCWVLPVYDIVPVLCSVGIGGILTKTTSASIEFSIIFLFRPPASCIFYQILEGSILFYSVTLRTVARGAKLVWLLLHVPEYESGIFVTLGVTEFGIQDFLALFIT